MKAYERFVNYAQILTPSNEANDSISPSSLCQFDLARVLESEMKEMGISDVFLDENCYVYGALPATSGCENCPKIALIAHLDTVSDHCDHPITPVIHENYDGKDLVLGTSGRTLSPEAFPHLPSLAGRTLITTDGTTVLGADDKAGIAEILTFAERLITENIPHGPIRFAFSPDEEIGSGAGLLDLARLDADFGYTLDGEVEGEIQYENFNACAAFFEIHGFSVHPGSSKDTMINACLVAMEINAMLPGFETPRDTEDYEGFYHLCAMEGNVDHAKLEYIVRDHNPSAFAARKETLSHIEKILNEKWGEGTVTLTIKDQYQNMCEKLKDCMHLIEHAKKACQAIGLEPKITPIRGGTDGAQLSFRGLPCPNLGTGGHAFHGPYEHITVEAMDLVVDHLIELIKLYAEDKKYRV